MYQLECSVVESDFGRWSTEEPDLGQSLSQTLSQLAGAKADIVVLILY